MNSPSPRLAGILERTGLLTRPQTAALVDSKQRDGSSITEMVVNQGFAEEVAFLRGLGEAMGLPFVQLAGTDIDTSVLEQLPTRVVFQFNVVPYALEDGVLRVTTNDPFDPHMADALRLVVGRRVRFALGAMADIESAIKRLYGVGAETVEAMMQDDEDTRVDIEIDESILKTDLNELDQEASIVKFVNQIVWEAYQERATDIHLEPMERELRIRYRIDGMLHATPLPPQLKRFQAAIISRIKVMANMDIAEKRLPQDGRISMRVRGEEIDIRVSTMPTVYGESVSLRLLMRGEGPLELESLGMHPGDVEIIRKLIQRPHGIILVTGPTGSGKSTSLYAYLQKVNTIDKRVITMEDPIEYEMAGINQVLVREDIGLTFDVGLRHILRQDPDVVMVGEIRDVETAEIAIRMAMTGHLVFSTLHTNDAAGAVTRLVEMGVEPFLVASSLEAVVAQRLVRRLCPECRKPSEGHETFLRSVGFPMERLAEGTIYEPAGCEACRANGYVGRVGVYEILRISDAILSLIVKQESADAIKKVALGEGMRTLRDDGWEKVLQGVTSVDEVLRVSAEESD